MKRIAKFFISLFYLLKNIGKCSFNPFSVVILRRCCFQGKNKIGAKTYLRHSSFGYGSYTGYSCEFSNCKIGKFTSIGNNVRVVSANHPIDFVSTHPFFYSKSMKGAFAYHDGVVEHLTTSNGLECEIGNDVWIGDNVLIKGGVKIGDGAVIGMGSVVLNDVAPYSIVAGIPAKAIKNRFSKETINYLLKTEWWNKPLSWIKNNAFLFNDFGLFLEKIRKEEKHE